MTQLAGKTLTVTGGASGIGRSAALHFASLGAQVAIGDLDEVQGAETVKMVAAAGGRAILVKTDVASEADVAALVSATLENFGQLDGAFNNAGLEQSIKRLHDIDIESWHKRIAVNLTGIFLCMKHQVPAMLERGGAIVNTASSLGEAAIPYAADYVAAKHGVVGLTRAAALDYARDNIRVNAVLPGMTQTPMIERGPVLPELTDMFGRIQANVPMQRLGQPLEIAAAAAWLLSDAASFVTGAAVPVDGGYLAA